MTATRIHITKGPDDFGRYHYVAEWDANNVGPHCNENGRRGQLFGPAYVQDTYKNFVSQGHTVEVTYAEGVQKNYQLPG